jgi:hypothetical protein
MLQQKVPTSSGGALWCSPERDIAHVMPLYFSKMLKVVEADTAGRTDIDVAVLMELATALMTFVEGCTTKRTATMQEAFEKSGLLSLYKTKEGEVLVRAFFRTVLSAYYDGATKALHQDSGETFANIDRLQVAVEEYTHGTDPKGPQSAAS